MGAAAGGVGGPRRGGSFFLKGHLGREQLSGARARARVKLGLRRRSSPSPLGRALRRGAARGVPFPYLLQLRGSTMDPPHSRSPHLELRVPESGGPYRAALPEGSSH